MSKKYIIYLPSEQGSVKNEWEQCLKQIVHNSVSDTRLIKLNIFADLTDFSSITGYRRMILESIKDSFDDYCPAVNITFQPPEIPWKVIVEAAFTTTDSCKITTRFWHEKPYIVIESDSGKEVWACGLGSDLIPDNTRDAASAAFDQVVAILDKEQMSLNHLVRQWNYIGNILAVNNGFQNYQIFNEVRNEYYHRFRNIPGYPAATGVGMKHGGVILDFCAVRSDGKVKIIPVKNPNQVNAYEYGQQLLKGINVNGKTKKHPPQFERALLLTSANNSVMYISGTASIIGQETIGINDISTQTIVTLENIKKLADKERINQIIGSKELASSDFVSMRVYIKNQKDFNVVRSICSEQFPSVPASYLEADICRDDLLMEVEAELEIKFK